MSWLEMFVARAFPNALVERLSHRAAYRVSIVVDEKEIMARRESTLRRVVQDLHPRFPKRRRLHWGKRK